MSPPLDDPTAGLGAAALEPPMPTDPAIDPNAAPAPPGLGAAALASTPTPAPPTAPDTDPTASHALLGRLLGSARKTQIGRLVDRYQKPAVGTAVKRLHADLKGLAQEGEPGRMWYEKSSKRILDYVQGDRGEAHKIAQLIAIYSPQTAVDVNTQNAIKAYNRAKSGQAMWAGDILEPDKTFGTIKEANEYSQLLAKQYPGGGGGNAGSSITKVPLDDSGKRFLYARHNMAGYENIATADRDLKAHLLMNHGIAFEGRKTNNFYRNLMVHIDPTIDQGSTQDLWMARAFGFHDDAISNATKYDFMEKLTHKLGRELGWKPHQVQAAIWTAMKTRQEAVKKDVMKEALDKGMASMVQGDKGKPKFTLNEGQEDAYSSLMRDRALEKVLDADHIRKSARDFSDFLDQNLAHVSWEATPSRSISHLAGLSDLSPEKRADYHKRISEALQDEHGNDLLAKHLGLLSPGTVEAPGYWQGDVNPASHLQVAATRIKAAGQQPDIDAASRELLDHYANARGLLLKQDGVGYHRPYFNPQVSKANGVEYQFEKPLSGDQIRNLGSLIDQIPDTALIPSGPGTMRIVNFSGMDDHKVFHKAVDAALQKFDSGGIVGHERLFASDGELRGNDWKVSPNGEDYKTRLSAAGRSDVLRFVSDVLAPKVEKVDRAFAKEHGLKRDERLERGIRTHPDEEGLDLNRGLGKRPKKADGGAVGSYLDDMEAAGVGRRSAEVARHAPTCPPDFPEAARRVWKEHRNRRGKAEGGAVSDDATSDDDSLYHVTLTKHLPKIQQDGIRPLQTSNWVQAGSGDRYGGGHIFAFDHPHDAEAWGAKMDWANHQKSGSGKVSIVKFKRDAGWQKDTADPLSQSGRAGNWLKKRGSVKSDQVVSHAPVTQETTRRVVQRLNRSAKAAGGALDMGSTPYSTDTSNAPGGTAQRGKDALGLIGSGGSSDVPAPGSGREFLGKLANDPNTDGMTRLFAAGMAKSGTFSGQDPTPPAPAVVDPNAKPDYPVIRAAGGRVSRADGGPINLDWSGAEGVDQDALPQTPPSPSYIKPIDENARKLSPIGLYSHAADTVWKSSQMKGSPAQYKAMLTKAGVKPDEFKWSGYDQAFAGKTSVTKREVRDHFVRNLPKIQETVKQAHTNEYGDEYQRHPDDDSWSEPKYSEYQLPGAKNYREVVLHLPEQKTKAGVGLGLPPGAMDKVNYHSSHWTEPNPLLHIRMSDRIENPPGTRWQIEKAGGTWKPKKILHVEELQSDYGQAVRDNKGFTNPEKEAADKQAMVDHIAQGRDRLKQLLIKSSAEQGKPPPSEHVLKGFDGLSHPSIFQLLDDPEGEKKYHELANQANSHRSNPLPPAPYVDSTAKWTDLGLKRVLHEAAKGGYDKVVFTPGEEQAKRYDLSDHIKELNYHPAEQRIIAYDHNGSDAALNKKGIPPEELHKYIGKETADKLMHPDNKLPDSGVHVLGGLDLKVGGEGMKGYYDTIVPKALEKLARQHDPEARVQVHAHELAKNPRVASSYEGSELKTASRLHALDITPKMRASILTGQKGYASGGRIAGRIDDHLYRRLRKVVDIGGRYP